MRREVRWGIEACDTENCPNDGEVLVDDMELLCIDCTDKRIERLVLIGEYGHDIIGKLPAFADWYEPPGYKPETQGKES